MRMAKRNQQKLYYALYKEEIPIYATDSDGNIIYDSYTTEEGEVITYPVEIERVSGYDTPVEFCNGISGKLSEVLMEAFGASEGSIYAQMDYMAHEYPFEVGTLIWKNSTIKYTDEAQTMPDETSADYKVVGILDEFPNVWSCLLKRVVK